MSTPVQADSQFQMFIRTFRQAFGIVNPRDVQTEQREIFAESIRIDAIVVFADPFDFTTLRERIFPFLGRYNVFEYKGEHDPLLVGHFYQYSLVELGLMVVRYLSNERTDREGRQWLSQRSARALWRQLKTQGAQHSSCTVILSTRDAQQLRKKVGFQPVADYPHLTGALYRRVISEDEFVGSIATYLVVLNHLPVCPINAPLLLLAKGRKQIEFCRWLLSDANGLTLEEKRLYQFYLIDYHLIQNEEVKQAMKYDLFGPPNHNWIFEELERRSEEERQRFFQLALQKMPEVISPEEAAQRLLHANSPVEVALKSIKTQKQLREFLERIQQRADEMPVE